MRTSSQIFDYDRKIKAAKKTLNIDPTDEIAINIIVDNYIGKNQIDKAVKFVENIRKKAGNNKYLQRNLYFMELTIIHGMDVTKGKPILNNLVKNFYITFYNNQKFLNEFTVIILKNAPFEIRPLKELLKISERAVSLEKKRNKTSNQLGPYLQTLARMYYYVGWYTKAISTQNRVVALLHNPKNKGDALLKEKYYIEALKINQFLK